MSSFRLGLLGAIPLAWVAAAPALAATPPTYVPLPSPAQPLSASPPLQTTAALFELRVPGRIRTRQRVVVGIDPEGVPVSVTATQRLLLEGAGDYSFVVPAPVIDLVAAPGSDSEPGLRRDAIIWQGFSPGRRVLASEARLRVGAVRRVLPLRVSLEARVGGVLLRPGMRRSGHLDLVLRLRNATAVRATTLDGTAVVADLARVLDRLRTTVALSRPFLQELVRIPSPSTSRSLVVEAPLDVRGTIRFPQGSVRDLAVVNARPAESGATFGVRLGDTKPLQLVVRVRGRARNVSAPVLVIEVAPAMRLSTLRPPRGASWRQAVARRLIRTEGRSLFRTTVDTILRVARVRQYETFLADPDTFARAGADRTVYLYRTAPRTVTTVSPTPSDGDGGGVLVPLLLAVGGVLVAGALLVVWAHS